MRIHDLQHHLCGFILLHCFNPAPRLFWESPFYATRSVACLHDLANVTCKLEGYVYGRRLSSYSFHRKRTRLELECGLIL